MQITIEDFEAYLKNTYGGFAEKNGVSVTEQNLFMKLVEEMGEVAEVLNKRSGRKSSDESNLDEELGKELADVIHYALSIAAVNGFDMNEIIIEKDRCASLKYNHKINLENFISEKHDNLTEN